MDEDVKKEVLEKLDIIKRMVETTPPSSKRDLILQGLDHAAHWLHTEEK